MLLLAAEFLVFHVCFLVPPFHSPLPVNFLYVFSLVSCVSHQYSDSSLGLGHAVELLSSEGKRLSLCFDIRGTWQLCGAPGKHPVPGSASPSSWEVLLPSSCGASWVGAPSFLSLLPCLGEAIFRQLAEKACEGGQPTRSKLIQAQGQAPLKAWVAGLLGVGG